MQAATVRTGLLVDGLESLAADQRQEDVLELAGATFKGIFDSILLVFVDERQEVLFEGVQAVLQCVFLLHGDEVPAAVSFELNSLERHEIEETVPAILFDVEFGDVASQFLAPSQSETSQQLLDFPEVGSCSGEGESVAAEAKQLDEGSAAVVERQGDQKEVGILSVVIGVHLGLLFVKQDYF